MPQIIILLSLFVFFCTSCTPVNSIKPERIAEIKKIGVVTKVSDNDFKVFDRTGTMNRAHMGGLIEGLILTGMARHAINQSLNGNPDDIKQHLKDINIKEKIDAGVVERLSDKYIIIPPMYFDKELNDNPSKYTDESDYVKEARVLGIDTLVLLDFAYGLAAYKHLPARAIIDGNMIVYDVASASLICKRAVASDQHVTYSHHYIDEFAKEDGKLYKEELNNAINIFSHLIANQLGISTQLE